MITNSIVVRLRDLDKLGGLLDALIRAGANRMDGIRFAIGDPSPLVNEARRKAIADAREKATLYATASGV